MIDRCEKLFRFIDFVHDKRTHVDIKYEHMQPPQYILDALFYKMKADYLRYIYECLSGESGLLYEDEEKILNLKEYYLHKETHEIGDHMSEFIECEMCKGKMIFH